MQIRPVPVHLAGAPSGTGYPVLQRSNLPSIVCSDLGTVLQSILLLRRPGWAFESASFSFPATPPAVRLLAGTNGRKSKITGLFNRLRKVAGTWSPSRTAPERSLFLPCLRCRTPPLSLFIPASTAISKPLLSSLLLLQSTPSSTCPAEIFLLSLCSAYGLLFRKGSSYAQLPSHDFFAHSRS